MIQISGYYLKKKQPSGKAGLLLNYQLKLKHEWFYTLSSTSFLLISYHFLPAYARPNAKRINCPSATGAPAPTGVFPPPLEGAAPLLGCGGACAWSRFVDKNRKAAVIRSLTNDFIGLFYEELGFRFLGLGV
jgi:hypothetical protein